MNHSQNTPQPSKGGSNEAVARNSFCKLTWNRRSFFELSAQCTAALRYRIDGKNSQPACAQRYSARQFQNTAAIAPRVGKRRAASSLAARRNSTPATRENVDLPVELRGGFGSRVFSGAV